MPNFKKDDHENRSSRPWYRLDWSWLWQQRNANFALLLIVGLLMMVAIIVLSIFAVRVYPKPRMADRLSFVAPEEHSACTQVESSVPVIQPPWLPSANRFWWLFDRGVYASVYSPSTQCLAYDVFSLPNPGPQFDQGRFLTVTDDAKVVVVLTRNNELWGWNGGAWQWFSAPRPQQFMAEPLVLLAADQYAETVRNDYYLEDKHFPTMDEDLRADVPVELKFTPSEAFQLLDERPEFVAQIILEATGTEPNISGPFGLLKLRAQFAAALEDIGGFFGIPITKRFFYLPDTTPFMLQVRFPPESNIFTRFNTAQFFWAGFQAAGAAARQIVNDQQRDLIADLIPFLRPFFSRYADVFLLAQQELIAIFSQTWPGGRTYMWQPGNEIPPDDNPDRAIKLTLNERTRVESFAYAIANIIGSRAWGEPVIDSFAPTFLNALNTYQNLYGAIQWLNRAPLCVASGERVQKILFWTISRKEVDFIPNPTYGFRLQTVSNLMNETFDQLDLLYEASLEADTRLQSERNEDVVVGVVNPLTGRFLFQEESFLSINAIHEPPDLFVYAWTDEKIYQIRVPLLDIRYDEAVFLDRPTGTNRVRFLSGSVKRTLDVDIQFTKGINDPPLQPAFQFPESNLFYTWTPLEDNESIATNVTFRLVYWTRSNFAGGTQPSAFPPLPVTVEPRKLLFPRQQLVVWDTEQRFWFYDPTASAWLEQTSFFLNQNRLFAVERYQRLGFPVGHPLFTDLSFL